MTARWTLALVLTAVAAGEDWPGWRGVNRDGISAEKGLADRWGAAGPEVKWTAKGLGGGYSTPSVAGGKIFVIGVKGDSENLIQLNAEDGSIVWSKPIGGVASVGYKGSRSTPSVDGDTVYAVTSAGDLVAASADSGAIKWRKSYSKDWGGRYGAWGFAESPLVDGDRLIVSPGGTKHSIVALNKATGEQLWTSKVGDDVAAYASPITFEAGGKKQYVQFLSKGVVGVDAESGQFLWRYSKSANGTANCSTPVAIGDRIFSASGYGTGGGMFQVKGRSNKFTATESYFSREFVNHHGGYVVLNKKIYGTNERGLLCMDFDSGKILWRDRSVGKGSIAAADGKLFVRGEGGSIAMVKVDPKSYVELGLIKDQPDRSGDPAWPHPVISGKTLYIRDQGVLIAFNLGK
jgi:outer membrane protein assembly factor BamB